MKKRIWSTAASALVVLATSLSAVTMAHAESTPAKKELIAKMLQLQAPASEALARQLAEAPAMRLMQQVGPALQFRVAPEKREALAKDIQGDMKKYVDEAVPLLRERAGKLAPTIVGPMLEEKFTEDELKQLIAFLESPVQKKLAQLNGDIQKSLSEKLVAETRGVIEPKVKVMEQAISQRVSQAVAAAPAAKPASK